jgi:hypothetical protein
MIFKMVDKNSNSKLMVVDKNQNSKLLDLGPH